MALINDPDDLNQATEIDIDTSALTITLNLAGNLSEDGVTGQALYSFLKEEWISDNSKRTFDFPMVSIGPEKFEFVDGWEPADDATRKLIRAAGWREAAAGGAVKREYLGVISLGNIDASSKTVGDKAYYAFSSDAAATEFTYAGPVDEAVQTFGDGSNGNFDKRTDTLTLFIRQQGKTYSQQSSEQIGVTAGNTLDYLARRFPLSEGTDLNISASDAQIIGKTPYFATADATASDGDVTAASDLFTSAGASFAGGDVGKFICIDAGPNIGAYRIIAQNSGTEVQVDRPFPSTETTISYSLNSAGMSITYSAVALVSSALFASDLQGGPFNFGIDIAGNSGTKQQIYEYVQFQLRNAGTIDFDETGAAKPGQLQDALLQFVGPTLESLNAANVDTGGTGVAVTGFDSNDTNDLSFRDNTAASRTFPFVAAGTLNFNGNLQGDANAIYEMYFTTNPGGNFNSAAAVTVEDNGGTPISGVVPGASVAFDFDYDGNNQGGRTPGQDADVTIVAIGLDTAAHVIATGTITRATGLSFTLVSSLERNYDNPA